MNFPNDGSSQTITNLSVITGTYNGIATSNDLNTKQNTLTSATNLLGIGSAITALDYNKITLNKPTNFQTDWNSTIINKPSIFPPDTTNIYIKTQIDTLITNTSNYTLNTSNTLKGFIDGNLTTSSNYTLNTSNTLKSFIDGNLITSSNYTLNTSNNLKGFIDTKQPNLTASTTLSGIGSNLTLINYNTLSNIPTTFNPDLTNIYNKSQTDTLLNTKQATLTTSTTILGIGSNLTLINYNNISNPPNLSIYALNSNLSSYSTTGNDPNYLLKSGGTITGVLNISNQTKLSTGIWHNSLQDNIQRFYFASNDITYFSCGKLSAGIGGFQYNNSLNNAIMSLTDAGNLLLPNGYLSVGGDFSASGNLTASGRIQFNSNVGIGTNNPNATLELYSTTQLNTRLILSGQEFYQSYSTNLNNAQLTGIALLCGVNRPTNKQLWIGDSALTAQNSTNGIIRIMPNGGYIDACSTNGTVLPLTLGNSGSQTTIYGSTINLTNNTGVSGTITINTTSTLDAINAYCYPNSINNTNGANRNVNLLNVLCYTTGLAKSTVLNCVVADGYNGIDTIITLACGSGANSGVNNSSRIVLDGSYNTNISKGAYASTINFQSINSVGTWVNNMTISGNGVITTPQFSTSSYNNLVMKTIFINPYSSIGGPYNNGYWLIDVYDYSSQYGFVYLFLNINAIGLLYWLGRVVIANSSSFNTYADMGYNVQLGLTTLNSRLQIIISCPSGTNNGLAQLCVKIIG